MHPELRFSSPFGGYRVMSFLELKYYINDSYITRQHFPYVTTVFLQKPRHANHRRVSSSRLTSRQFYAPPPPCELCGSTVGEICVKNAIIDLQKSFCWGGRYERVKLPPKSRQSRTSFKKMNHPDLACCYCPGLYILGGVYRYGSRWLDMGIDKSSCFS